MKIYLSDQEYGKSSVRLSHVDRSNSQHELTQLTAQILLKGDFDNAYVDGDNAHVVPTDTMKNTVYALAKNEGIKNIESFACRLAQRFVNKFAHVHQAKVQIEQQLWSRFDIDGEAHGHAFVGGGSEQNTCVATTTKEETKLSSGLTGLQVLKTTESGFSGFLRDEYTSLQDTDDRIFATTITAEWPCPDLEHDWEATRRTVRNLLLDVFAHNYSPSVQKTLHEMADSVLSACNEIEEISLSMPNQHHLLANLQPINLDNDNEVFVPATEPFGIISATIKRTQT